VYSTLGIHNTHPFLGSIIDRTEALGIHKRQRLPNRLSIPLLGFASERGFPIDCAFWIPGALGIRNRQMRGFPIDCALGIPGALGIHNRQMRGSWDSLG